ncbi:MAG: hypothetical protein D8M56_02620 [Chloroflexi bacterium]|nr:hypothetical protein [Chloroflexota bacterium]
MSKQDQLLDRADLVNIMEKITSLFEEYGINPNHFQFSITVSQTYYERIKVNFVENWTNESGFTYAEGNWKIGISYFKPQI